MGKVAAAFLGTFGKWLIVAGAIFSMVSASNTSILAASGIGSLMGQQVRPHDGSVASIPSTRRRSGDDSTTFAVPTQPTFEVKAEREGTAPNTELCIEFELE